MVPVKRTLNRYPQQAKEPLLTSRNKPNAENRVAAKLIDALIIESILALAAFVWYPASYVLSIFVLASLLWGAFELIGRGQSPGKWLLGLHTIEVTRGMKINLYSGIVRNFPFIIFSIGLGRSGWFAYICLMISVICIFIEAYFIFAVRSGIRVGDIIGASRVCDYKDEHTKFIEQFLKEEESV